ncbi:MAG: hypothetical protein HOE69_00845 [Euryarchaeota archaeon]|jgi:hypothetical protein|nr:hypothetical protein [Euryarchaeota archaeon]
MTAPEPENPVAHSVERRLSDLKREVDAIKRLLTQASLKRLSSEINRQQIELEEVENEFHSPL